MYINLYGIIFHKYHYIRISVLTDPSHHTAYKTHFRRADIRRIPGGYPPSGWIFRDVTDGTGSLLSLRPPEIGFCPQADRQSYLLNSLHG